MIDEKTLWLIGNDLVNELTKVAPVDTGRLKNSIKVSNINKDKLSISMVDYAAYVEFGTKKMNPNPFITNTLKNKLGNIMIRRLEGARLKL